MSRPQGSRGWLLGTLALLLLAGEGPQGAPGGRPAWSGSLRVYGFFRLESLPAPFSPRRRDSEFSALRLQGEWTVVPGLELESHLVMDFLSPAAAGRSSLVAGREGDFLPLQHSFPSRGDWQGRVRLDRLNLRLDLDPVRLQIGRQAISWGVNYFWPSLDLFSTFAPQRIDREYKEGVDSVRVFVPLGDLSELQVVGAVLGSSRRREGALGALARLHLGRADLGLMGGAFHGDTVLGMFLVADTGGSSLRGELTWTRSDELLDRRLGRERFWRASLGLDRQLSPRVGWLLELAYNGFGSGSPSRYLLWLSTDRVRRGEMTALGTFYTGTSLSWRFHPLGTLTQSVLVNWQDPSALWIPALEWSASANSTLTLAAQLGSGRGFGQGARPESEYGPVPALLMAALRWYF